MFNHNKYPSLMRWRIEALSERERERERVKGGLHSTYQDIISVENLLAAWQEFLRGKRSRKDVADFSLRLLDNIAVLHQELASKTYRHGGYRAFKINDPKPRDIHKATVRDRLLHHAIHRVLYPYFECNFIYDSYSCRFDKGQHHANNRLRAFARKVSKNHTRTVWTLKCDVRKFFANIDHSILIECVRRHINDEGIIWLLGRVVESFSTKSKPGVGLPLGNLTSQLLVNIYMNVFDHFVKRRLKATYYIRFSDDFVILHHQRDYLETLLQQIQTFLQTRIKLMLHPDKVSITTIASGVDFLGWVHFPHHRILRASTRRRMLKRLEGESRKESISSYLGMLKHGNGYKLGQVVQSKLNQDSS